MSAVDYLDEAEWSLGCLDAAMRDLRTQMEQGNIKTQQGHGRKIEDRQMTWWVVQTESQREHMVRVLLMRRQYETYLPRIKERSRIAPLFPSYLFVRAAEQWYPVRWTDHVVRLLISGDQPAQLPEKVMTEIRKREIGGFVKLPAPVNRLRKGARVRITRGNFEGQIALCEGMSSKDRVWVLLNLLGQKVPVELPERDLEVLHLAKKYG